MNSCRIFIVEDEAIVAMDIQDRLTAMGYELSGVAAGGEQALALVEAKRPDLVLMDIRLQGNMDGIVAAEEIRRRFHVPVIFLTAYSEEATLERAKLAEPFGYILKPFDNRELKSTIEIALYKHRAEQEIHCLNRLYDVLSQVNQTILRVRTREDLFQVVCRLLVERGAVDLAWIGMLDPETSRVSPVARFGHPTDMLAKASFYANEQPEGQGNPGWAIRTGKPFVCNECGNNSCLYPSEQAPVTFGFHSCASFPIRFQGEACGALNLCVTEPEFFREREIALLTDVATDISFALDKIEDDTQRELLKVQFERQSTFLGTLMDAMPYPVFYKDTQLRYLGCNKAFEQLLGTGRNKIIGRASHEFWTPDCAALFQRTDLEVLAGTGQKTLIAERMLEGPESTRHHFLIHKASFRNPDGTVGGIIGALVDITDRKQAENALLASEERFRLAMQGASDGLWDRNLETGEVYYSPRWKSMLGYTEDELEHNLDTWKRLIHPDDLGPTEAKVSELIEGRADKFEAEFRMRHKNGHYVAILSRAFLFRPSEDEAGRVVGTHVDITGRKQAEEALRNNELKYRALVEHIPQKIFYKDRKSAYISCNDFYARDLGIRAADIVGRNDFEFFPHDLAAKYRADDGRVMESGRDIEVEEDYIRDGNSRTILTRKVPLFDNRGEVRGVLGVFTDITERKVAQKALRASEAKFRSYIESAPLAIFVADQQGRLMDSNPAAMDLLGYDAGALAGMDILDIHPEEDRESVQRDFTILLEKGHVEAEHRLKRRDGSLIWVSLHAVTTTDQLSLAYCQDITERKQAENERTRIETQLRQAQKMEALGTLAGGIAHDFNNILGIIMGYTEMAKLELGEGNPILADFGEVLTAALRAKELVKQILAFSRRTEQEKIPLQLGLIVKEALKILRPSLPSTIEINTNVLSKAVISADPTQMHQVLMNLCTNAAHAMQDRGGELDVRLTDTWLETETIASGEILPPGHYVELAVKDNGHGINPAIINLIFDPFFTTKGPGEGTGLGLSVVHGITKSHGGAIIVESLPGRGTTFTVLIPALGTESTDIQLEAAPHLPCGKERILVVDDEPMLAGMVKKMLEKLGYDVVFRTSGVDALETFRNQPKGKYFDLVITDMTMPHFTGTDLALELSGVQPSVPIILMTGFSKKIDADKVKDFGIQGFLMKPVAIEELARMVRAVLDQKTACVR